MKFIVTINLPSGSWTVYETDDRSEADALAASEQARLGVPHKVYVRT